VEFRCRLASASGEVVEGVYVAENEARLRHELEEKGLYVLSLQQKGALAGLSFRLPSRSSVPSREFLIFNQELATLLRAGMPLVQSLDLLKSRIQSPVFRSVLIDVTSASGAAVPCRMPSPHTRACFRACIPHRWWQGSEVEILTPFFDASWSIRRSSRRSNAKRFRR
jgi:hypothetical protein